MARAAAAAALAWAALGAAPAHAGVGFGCPAGASRDRVQGLVALWENDNNLEFHFGP